MPSYTVYVNAEFSDSVEVEAESEDEARELAVAEFEQNYQVVSGYGLSWDNVYVDSVEEDDEDEDEDA